MTFVARSWQAIVSWLGQLAQYTRVYAVKYYGKWEREAVVPLGMNGAAFIVSNNATTG